MPGSFLTEDLAEFLDSSELGDSATFNSNTFDCQFFDAYESADLFGTGEVETSNPHAICKLSDVPGDLHGKSFVVNGITYKIRGSKPDGTGMTLLVLSKD